MEHLSVNQDESQSRGIVDRVKQQATTQFSTQKDRATDGLGKVASAIRQSSQPLRDNNQDMLADYVAKAADQIDRFSARLRESDMDSLMSDARRFAHRRPGVFVGAAFAVGVIAARFLKSSGPTASPRELYTRQLPVPRAAQYPGGL
jgi:hypothetical protein